MKKALSFAVALGFLCSGCITGVQGVRVDTDWGIVDIKENGDVSAQIEVDGVEFYIEDGELVEINVPKLVEVEL